MDITKLYTKPGGLTYAAQIQDGTESYPVLMETLGTAIILPELLKSGWQLDALPLKLSKNGMPLESLPKAEWTQELEMKYGQDMYDMIGTPIPQDELRKMLYKGSTTSSFLTCKSYRYNTREEFLAYLNGLKNGVADEDFMPLNCMVAPNARFSLEEFARPENRPYTQVIALRRNFSYTRYTKLVEFLHKHGLPEQFNSRDFLQAYHQWGVDGLQFAMTGSPRITDTYVVWGGYGSGGNTEMALMPAMERVYALLLRTAQGVQVVCPPGVKQNDLYNSDQIHPFNAFADAEEQRNHMFDTTHLESVRAGDLKVGEAMAIQRSVRRPQSRLEINVANSSIADHVYITYSRIEIGETLSTGGFSFSTSAGTPMTLDCIGNPEAQREVAFTMAIANDVIARRKKPSNHTLLSALAENGFSLLPSLSYTLTMNKMGVPGNPFRPEGEESAAPAMSQATLEEYVRAQVNPDNATDILGSLSIDDPYELSLSDARAYAVEVLDGIVNGTTTDPDLAQAIMLEDSVTPTSYYEIFRALTSCTNLTIRDIYEQVQKWTPGQPLTIKADSLYISADGGIVNYVDQAYNKIKNNIRLTMARDAYFYVWVDGAIKALGDPDNDQHSGFYATVVDMRKAKAQEARKAFAYYYADRVVKDLEPLKDSNPAKWNTMMNTFLGDPSSSINQDYTKVARAFYSEGIATYVAASMLMQFIKTDTCRIPLPSGEIFVSGKDAPELKAYAETVKKYIINTDKAFFCDCQTYCDHVMSVIPGDNSYYFYTVNAVVTPDKVLPRPGCKIMEYDGVFAYNYSTFADIYENAGTPEKLPHACQRAFLNKNEIQRQSLDTDLVYSLISGETTGFKSYLPDYYKDALAICKEWKANNPHEHLDMVTGPWEAAWSADGVQPVSSGRAEVTQTGLPCFRPDNTFHVLTPTKVAVEEAESPIKPFRGITAKEFYDGADAVVLPPRAGRAGYFTVDGDFITIGSRDTSVPDRTINPGDLVNLNQEDYPVRHIYGNRWVIRDITGALYSVEV